VNNIRFGEQKRVLQKMISELQLEILVKEIAGGIEV